MAYELDEHTVSLLHFEDGIKDETGKPWTAYNGAITTAEQSRIDEKSLRLNGTNQYISTTVSDAFKFGTGDFTVECWIYPKSVSSTTWNCIFDNRKTVDSSHGFTLCIYKGNLTFAIDDKTRPSSVSVSLNTWQHVAIVRSSGTVYLFLNGVVIYTGALTNDLTEGYCIVGEAVINSFYFNGYIDEFRVSNTARWTSNFNLAIPINLVATSGNSQVLLSWDAVSGATGYNVKRATAAGGPYTTIATNVSTNSYVDTDVVNGTTYYYVVTAVTADGESPDSNEASATPAAPPIDVKPALLRVTVIDSSEREYQLTTVEIDGFITWFNNHASSDATSYMLAKKIGLQSSKEYLAFDKIISFEVIPLAE